ncbi:hypothetical protein EVAR_38378_1 [Eumeta japonica]|uniref:Uncharacterized protein n=1 Tax=Eumeta variegata TaxID=151549 RepID=A0A4C1XXK8_EUMVA|nr:hypothetical protein EVAR_38378_1 [Eumeta japonica]
MPRLQPDMPSNDYAVVNLAAVRKLLERPVGQHIVTEYRCEVASSAVALRLMSESSVGALHHAAPLFIGYSVLIQEAGKALLGPRGFRMSVYRRRRCWVRSGPRANRLISFQFKSNQSTHSRASMITLNRRLRTRHHGGGRQQLRNRIGSAGRPFKVYTLQCKRNPTAHAQHPAFASTTIPDKIGVHLRAPSVITSHWYGVQGDSQAGWKDSESVATPTAGLTRHIGRSTSKTRCLHATITLKATFLYSKAFVNSVPDRDSPSNFTQYRPFLKRYSTDDENSITYMNLQNKIAVEVWTSSMDNAFARGSARVDVQSIPSSRISPHHEIKTPVAVPFLILISVLLSVPIHFIVDSNRGPAFDSDVDTAFHSDSGYALDSNLDPTLDFHHAFAGALAALGRGSRRAQGDRGAGGEERAKGRGRRAGRGERSAEVVRRPVARQPHLNCSTFRT